MRNKKTIIKLIEQIIRSWLEEDYERLNACLNKKVVMSLPHVVPHSMGRKAVCETLKKLHAGRTFRRFD